jgi:hypothetical protein
MSTTATCPPCSRNLEDDAVLWALALIFKKRARWANTDCEIESGILRKSKFTAVPFARVIYSDYFVHF